jgi:hypothetical protein
MTFRTRTTWLTTKHMMKMVFDDIVSHVEFVIHHVVLKTISIQVLKVWKFNCCGGGRGCNCGYSGQGDEQLDHFVRCHSDLACVDGCCLKCRVNDSFFRVIGSALQHAPNARWLIALHRECCAKGKNNQPPTCVTVCVVQQQGRHRERTQHRAYGLNGG